MQFNPHLGLSRFIGRREGRRVPGRLPQELLMCSLGPVLDLSVGGMRVLSTKPRAGTLDVGLQGGDVGGELVLQKDHIDRAKHGLRSSCGEDDEEQAQETL